MDRLQHTTHWRLEKRRVREEAPYAVEEWEGNILLNEGINGIWGLVTGQAVTNFANAHIGVGDSTTAVAATQTGLQAPTNKAWAAMDVGYPQAGSDQKVVFRATFADGVAQFAWNELTVVNAANDSGINLNRAVVSKGTKQVGETWSLMVTITLN